MIDKVQKIREEVRKIARSINPYIPDDEGKNSEYEAGRFAMVTQIMQIIDSLQEEPVSEDLEEASKEWLRPQLDKSYVNYGEVKMMELTHFDGYAMLDAIEFGAKWQKAKDESTTEDLGEYINELSKQFPEVSFAKLSRIAVRVAKWQKSNLWKPADGDYLPEIDREVIALLNDGKVVFAHRPYKGKYIGKNLTTGNIETFENETYDKGGWNIPNVKWWLDVYLPKEIEL